MLTIDQYTKQLAADIRRRRDEAYARHQAELAAVKKTRKPFDVPPLVDQLRTHLANLPPSARARVSIPALLPHLQGRWREHPHYIQIAHALRALGYTETRSYKKADAGRRYWLAPATP